MSGHGCPRGKAISENARLGPSRRRRSVAIPLSAPNSGHGSDETAGIGHGTWRRITGTRLEVRPEGHRTVAIAFHKSRDGHFTDVLPYSGTDEVRCSPVMAFKRSDAAYRTIAMSCDRGVVRCFTPAMSRNRSLASNCTAATACNRSVVNRFTAVTARNRGVEGLQNRSFASPPRIGLSPVGPVRSRRISRSSPSASRVRPPRRCPGGGRWPGGLCPSGPGDRREPGLL